MTTPVHIEAPPGASPLTPGNLVPAVADPALAAEFAVVLDAANSTAVKPATPASELPALAVIDQEVPPGPEPNAIIPALGREGETETARSAVPIEILDSAPKTREELPPSDPLGDGEPPVLNDFVCVLRAPVLPPASPAPRTPNSGGRSAELPPIIGVSIAAGKDGSLVERMKLDAVSREEAPHKIGFAAELIGPPEIAPETSAADPSLPEALLTDVTSITGGGATFAESDRESNSEESGTPEIALGEATSLVTEGSEGFEVTRTERLEARPLDRTERTKIVHQVIDRVTKHVETLAVSRSKEPLTIRLEPADLGRVVVEISRESAGLVAEMSASDPRVAEALDRHRGELAAGLAAKGHIEARITVNAAPASENPAFDLRREGGQNPHQQPGHSSSQRHPTHANAAAHFATSAARPRTRIRAAGLDLEI